MTERTHSISDALREAQLQRLEASLAAADHDHVEGFGGGGGGVHGFIIRPDRQVHLSGKKLGMNSKCSVKAEVVEGDLGVFFGVNQNEISVKFSCLK